MSISSNTDNIVHPIFNQNYQVKPLLTFFCTSSLFMKRSLLRTLKNKTQLSLHIYFRPDTQYLIHRN